MTFITRPRRSARCASALIVACVGSAVASTKNYVGPDNGTFGTAANWSPSGVPANGDDVILGANKPTGLTGDLHVTMTGTFPSSGQFKSFTLNSSALPAYMIVNQTSGALSTSNMYLGTTSIDNTFNQSGGSINSFAELDLGLNNNIANNFYTVSGSTTTLSAGDIEIGVAGRGTLTQSGGTVNVANMLVARSSTATGSYNMSGGTLSFDGTLGVSCANAATGNAFFNQTGGSVVSLFNGFFYGVLQIGNYDSASGTGTYTFGGGSISVPQITVAPHGVFNFQNGASLTNPFSIDGGMLMASGDGSVVSTVTVSQSGATVRLNGHTLAVTQLVQDFPSPGPLTFTNGAAAPGVLTITPLAPYGGMTDGFNGSILDGGTGSLGITLLGTNTYVIYPGSTLTYSGPTTLATTLVSTAGGSLSPNSTVVLIGGHLPINTGLSQTIGGLAGTSGSVELLGGAAVLTIGTNNSNTVSGGTINGPGTINKIGSGTLTLNGGGSFAGTINVQQGTLGVGAANGIPVNALVSVGFSGGLAIAANQTMAGVSSSSLSSVTFSNNATLTVGAANLDGVISPNFNGAGTIVQSGAGTLAIGIGDSVSNVDPNLTLAVSAGTLLLNKQPGTIAAAGPLLVSGGTMRAAASNTISAATNLTVNGGAFDLNGTSQSIANLFGSGGALSFGPGAGSLTVTQTTAATVATNLSGPGTFAKLGAADLTLSGVSSYVGVFNVSAGRLILQGPLGATGYSVASGTTLRFSSATANVAYGAIQPAAGATVEYSNTTVNGGNLDGPGAQNLFAGAAFNGTTAQPGVVLNQTGSSTLTNFSNNGTINSNAALTWSYGVNSFAGTLNVNSTLAITGFASAGIINVATNSAITNTVLPLTLGAGSRTYLGTSNVHGGTLTLSGGTTLEVNAGLLVNNGTINGTVNVNYGATAKGSGIYGPVNVNDGGRFSPGNSPGTVTTGSTAWNAGGSYTVEIYDATGAAGTGYDLWNITGDLAVGAGNTTDSQFTIALTSLSSPTTPGQAIHFNPSVVNTFQVAHVTGSISGFNASRFTVSTAAFSNPLPSTTFRLSQVGNDLFVSNGPPSVTVPMTLSAGQVVLTTLTVTGVAILDAGSGHASDVNALVMPANGGGGYLGRVDLVDSDLVLHTGILATVADEIHTWYDAGARDGNGLGASFANPSTPATSLLTLGVLANMDGAGHALYSTLDGLPTIASDVLVKFTYIGDTDLNGRVDGADLANLVAGLNGGLTGWVNGDLNYDGVVNGIDLTLLFTSLQNQGAPFGVAGEGGSVPEPSTWALLLPLTGTLARRRRVR